MSEYKPNRISIVTPELFNEEYIYVHGEKYRWMRSQESLPHNNFPVGWWINIYSKVHPSEQEVKNDG